MLIDYDETILTKFCGMSLRKALLLVYKKVCLNIVVKWKVLFFYCKDNQQWEMQCDFIKENEN